MLNLSNILDRLPIKRLPLMIFKSFSGPFFASFSITLFVLVLQFLVKYLEDIMGKGIEPLVLGKVFLYASATLVTMALPISILFSSLMTLGNLGERYELAAIKSAGIGLFRVVQPMVIFTLFLTLFSFYFSFFMIPKANLKLFSLLYDVSKVKPTFNLSPGHFYGGIDGYVIHVGDIDRDADMVYNVKIYDHTEEKRRGNFKILVADSARMFSNADDRFIRMQLFHGVRHDEFPNKKGDQKANEYSRYYFDTLNYHMELTGFDLERTNVMALNPHQYMKDIYQLKEAVDSLEIKAEKVRYKMKEYMHPIIKLDSSIMDQSKGYAYRDSCNEKVYDYFALNVQMDILNRAINNARTVKNYATFTRDKMHDEVYRMRKYEIEYFTRISLPISCLIFLMIGAPLGGIIRKGGLGPPVLVSVFFFILFYVLMIQGKKFARDGLLPVWIGVFLPNLILLPTGIGLTYKSSTDSKLFDVQSWWKGLKNIFFFLIPIKKVPDDE